MQRFTILGGSGFIGSNLIRELESQSIPYWAPSRYENIFNKHLGHVIYCIGLTADYRGRPFETVRAHVCHLVEILEKAEFESLLYLSSTRLYKGIKTAREDATLYVNPTNSDDLYNISKLMGESLCLAFGRPNVQIARLSNVYERDFLSENFLSSVIREAVENHRVVLQTTMASEKDYVHIDDVVRLLVKIALSGRHRIYNVASGVNTTNGALIEVIQQVTGCVVEVAKEATTVVFAAICIDRIRDEFDFTPSLILDSLGNLVVEYQRKVETN